MINHCITFFTNIVAIAHYNWYGFKDYYSDLPKMIEFLEELLHHHFNWGAACYMDIGNAMKALSREELPKTIELEQKRMSKEKAMLHALVQKHGYTVAASSDTSDENKTMTPELLLLYWLILKQ